MINRILLRIKIIQVLYAYYKNTAQESNPFEWAKNELSLSIDKTYDLYHYLLTLVIEITDYAESRIGKKNRPESESQCALLAQNLFVKQLRENIQLKNYVDERDINWSGDDLNNVVKELYAQILASEEFAEYAKKTDGATYESDKELWRQLFKRTISDSESLGKALEDISIYWNDDAEVVVSFILKTIKRFSQEAGADQPLLPKFKDEEDEKFAYDLFKKSIYGENEYRKMIADHTKNWESDRIAFLDTIIMQTAIAEICNFPSIPVNVSMNEYIEIAKNYSTGKSGFFINGVLDAVTKELKANGKLVKVAYVNTYKNQL